MLKTLFSSSVRADVLELLFNSPEEKFYLREVSRLLNKNPSGVKKELDKLELMGIVISEKVANLKYFKVDRNSPLFSELKELISKSLGITGSLKSLLKANNIKTSFIYGLYAEGEDVSTIDLMIVGVSTPTLLIGLQDIEKKFNKTINCTIIDETEYKTKKRKDTGLKRILVSKRIALLGRI